MSRAERRQEMEAMRRRNGLLRTTVTTWWVYVFAVAFAVCVIMGERSTQEPLVAPGIHVTNPAPQP